MSALAPHLRRFLALALLLSLLAPLVTAGERIPPAPKRHVSDDSGTLSRRAFDELNTKLEQFERESSNQLLVAMFRRMDSRSSVEDYTVRVAESWHVGQKGKNNGAVLFIFKQDRKLYIQVGYGLEPRLTDALCHDIVENILKPRFRAGDFDGGVRQAVDAMIAATRGEFKGTGRTHAQQRKPSAQRGGFIFLGLIFFGGVFLVILLRVITKNRIVLGRPRTHHSSPWWMGSSSSSWGGWSSGGSSSSSGWSSGGGGFSGGGGSFGGGGAGGSW